MEVIFNGNLVHEGQMHLNIQNRAFAYGDGLFETMIVQRGSCNLLSYHFKRLKKGATILQLALPFSEKELEGYIWQLAAKARHTSLRMRLQLWRQEGGLYTPEQHGSEFLLSAVPLEQAGKIRKKAGIAQKVTLTPSGWSGLKTMNALPYVLAGLEKKERGLEELILTDSSGHVAECTAANLFWYSQGSWYTPSLESGCIAGVMRAYLLDQMQQQQIPVQEILLPQQDLQEAEILVACNVTGLYSIMAVENHTFKDGREQLASLIQLPVL